MPFSPAAAALESTVAMLAQGTHWAVAVTQALFVAGSNPARCTFLSKLLQALVGPGHHPPCAPHNNPNRGWFQLGWRERGMVFSKLDTLGFEPRAFHMRSGCDTTTPCALEESMLAVASTLNIRLAIQTLHMSIMENCLSCAFPKPWMLTKLQKSAC